MDSTNYNTQSRKHKHLNYEERMTIQIRLKDGFTPYRIAKELKRPINTVLNEIRRGTVDQIVNKKLVKTYLADAGQTIYEKNRKNSCPAFKLLRCKDFIDFVTDKVKKSNWSLDACVGRAIAESKFKHSEMVCTKTLYNYVALGLLPIKAIDLPLVLRRNPKNEKVRKHKKHLGRSIEERPEHIELRDVFGHWEIDTVLGHKTKNDNVILTLVERQTRYSIFLKISDKTSDAVASAISELEYYYGSGFDKVFKTITSDNGLEFSELHTLESKSETNIYFAHPYASHERGTNERHNGMLRRFIPKGKAISDYSCEDIAYIENWCNTLPRKILGYKTPEELFEEQLDIIYAT